MRGRAALPTDARGPGRVASVRFTAGLDPTTRARIRRILEAAGITQVQDHDDVDLPEIVFMERATSDVLELVESLSRGGLVRVLAVTTAPDPSPDEASWRLLAAGASDVVAWHGTVADPADVIVAKLARWDAVDSIVSSPELQGSLVGEGARWVLLLREIVEVARFTDASVLVTGESGTGKELIARLIHDLDPRPSKGELVVLDCTTVVPTLSGSEFFGHEKGAFTGATSTRDGAFALADGGTLFLDEVGDLPGPLQAELLRVIQEGMYKRVGSNTWRMTRFRLVCATNRDLDVEQEAGRFRRDLFYRIAEWRFRLPSLRERTTDIPLLTRAFLSQAHPAGAMLEIDEPVARLLADRAYPGNVRDLRQFVSRIAKRHVGEGPITVGDVPPGERVTTVSPPFDQPGLEASPGGGDGEVGPQTGFAIAVRAALASGMTLAEIKEHAADAAIEAAIAAEGSRAAAARRLGVTPRALQLRQAAHQSRPPSTAPSSGPDRAAGLGRQAHR